MNERHRPTRVPDLEHQVVSPSRPRPNRNKSRHRLLDPKDRLVQRGLPIRIDSYILCFPLLLDFLPIGEQKDHRSHWLFNQGEELHP